jgi:hypothetical protein
VEPALEALPVRVDVSDQTQHVGAIGLCPRLDLRALAHVVGVEGLLHRVDDATDEAANP